VLVVAVAFWELILALHILAVVLAFGVGFAWPLVFGYMARADPRSLPAVYRMERIVERWLVTPSLAAVLLCGIYLASHLHQWSSFYVQWGLGAVIVIGGILGGVLAPTEKRAAEIAERELATAGHVPGELTAEHQALVRRLQVAGSAASLIVILTIYFMVTHTGA
jgi:uncharacterized membrane protein